MKKLFLYYKQVNNGGTDMGKTISVFAFGGLAVTVWVVVWYKIMGLPMWVKGLTTPLPEKRCATCRGEAYPLTPSMEKKGASVCAECADKESARRHAQAQLS